MWWAPTSMTKNNDRKWAFRPGRAGDAAANILWAVNDGKNSGRREGEENIGEFPVMVGGRGLSDAHFTRTHTRICARRWLKSNPSEALGSS